MSSCIDCWEQTEKWLKSNAPDFVYEAAEAMYALALKQKKLIEYQTHIIQLKEQLISGLFSEDEMTQEEADGIFSQLEQTDQHLDELNN